MDIDAGYLSYIIKDIQQLKEYEENISNIICQYAKRNLWDNAPFWYYGTTFHMCVEKEILNREGWCGCTFKSWQEFIDEEYFQIFEIHDLLDWDWFYRHEEHCPKWAIKKPDEESDEESDEEEVCECFMDRGNILQLGFLWQKSTDTQPCLVYARINVSKDDGEDIRKFINKHRKIGKI